MGHYVGRGRVSTMGDTGDTGDTGRQQGRGMNENKVVKPVEKSATKKPLTSCVSFRNAKSF